jgi:hypothetical protein
VLVGGGSLLRDLDQVLRERDRLPIMRSEDPFTAVVLRRRQGPRRPLLSCCWRPLGPKRRRQVSAASSIGEALAGAFDAEVGRVAGGEEGLAVEIRGRPERKEGER